MPAWLLVHPPVLGPAVLQPLATELRRRGGTVAVPDLRATVTTAVGSPTTAVGSTAAGWPQRWVGAAARTGPAEVVVGFSGAGMVLPAVAAAVSARRVVWLDAVVPGPSGQWSPEIRQSVAPLVHDGVIADWTTWWGPEAMTDLLPDERVRAAVLEEGHALPADFYDVAVPVPGRWPDDDVRYVQLSSAYDRDAAAARSRGWDVRGDATGAHLDVATDPARVAELLA